MFGVMKIKKMKNAKYRFSKDGTLVFITGTPLSGKTTVAHLVASLIEGCTLQSMDIMRLIAQEMENRKAKVRQNLFVRYGSCDSYRIIGDGSYSVNCLLKGFNNYAEAVSSVLRFIVPNLEVQGAYNVLFEGVQLIPNAVKQYLQKNNKLIILTARARKLESNRKKIFKDDPELTKRYSNNKLLLLQNEIIAQGEKIKKDKVFFVENAHDCENTANKIIFFLLKTSVIEKSGIKKHGR